MKEAVKGRVPVSMDALVQQTESPFTAGVLHFPLPAKFRMPQIETFDGTKDPIDHLNTYKNQMKLHGYQDPIQCRAFAITLKGHYRFHRRAWGTVERPNVLYLKESSGKHSRGARQDREIYQR